MRRSDASNSPSKLQKSGFITRKGAHVKLPVELHVGERKVEEGGGPASQSENDTKRIETWGMDPRLG